jgi:transcriptional regulator NrdR family protein
MFGFEKVGKCVSEYGVAAERQRPTLDILINYHRRRRCHHCRRRFAFSDIEVIGDRWTSLSSFNFRC